MFDQNMDLTQNLLRIEYEFNVAFIHEIVMSKVYILKFTFCVRQYVDENI
jgi:hypothetical protein